MQNRRRFLHETTLEERLIDKAKRLRETAKTLPPGFERESLVRKARQVDTASHMNEWLNSPGLKAPT
jgi:hypothetical protein